MDVKKVGAWPIFVSALALILLLVHTFGWGMAHVDNTSIILLALMLLSPFVSTIRKLKVGEFEAEIGAQEVKELTADAKAILPAAEATGVAQPLPSDLLGSIETIKLLVTVDRVLALAKLRIEIERILRDLITRHAPHGPKQITFSIQTMAQQLTATKTIEPGVLPLIRRVADVSNRAIPGNDIDAADTAQ